MTALAILSDTGYGSGDWTFGEVRAMLSAAEERRPDCQDEAVMVAEQGNEELEGGDVGAEVGLGVEVEGGT